MKNVIKLSTNTGLLVPGGVALPIARGPQDATLQFLTAGVATLLADGAPIALKLYALSDTDNPVAVFDDWTPNAAFNCYEGTINPLETDLGYVPAGTLLGRFSYGNPNVDTPLFHVLWGTSSEITGGAPLQVINPGEAIFKPAFVELTGSARSLGSRPSSVAEAAAALVLTGTVGGKIKRYQVRVGTDAQTATGIIRPPNFNAETNAVVYVAV